MYLFFLSSSSMMSLDDCAGQMESLDGRSTNKDAGVRWLTLSKAAIGDKEQQNEQHHEAL